MKRILHLIIAALLVLCAACKKESKPVYTGISAKKGNQEWKADAVNTVTDYKLGGKNDTLIIGGHSVEGNIVMLFAQKGKGTYTGNEIKGSYYQTGGSGVVEASYRLVSSPENFVTITDYDEAGSILKGTFNLIYKRVEGSNLLADTLKFTNGKINIQLTARYGIVVARPQ